MSQAPSRRRWYQFGIGTMLVTIALFALWLGWEMHKVRERDRLIRSPEFLRLLEYRLSCANSQIGKVGRLFAVTSKAR